MKGWFNQSWRHSLASKGIRTSLSVKNPTDNEIRVLKLLSDGTKQNDVAKQLNLSQSFISRVRRRHSGEPTFGVRSYPQAKMESLDIFDKPNKEERKLADEDQKMALRELKRELGDVKLAPLPVRISPIPGLRGDMSSPHAGDIPIVDWDSYRLSKMKKYDDMTLRQLRKELKTKDVSNREATLIKEAINEKLKKLRKDRVEADLLPSPFIEDEESEDQLQSAQIVNYGPEEEQEVIDYEDQDAFRNKGY